MNQRDGLQGNVYEYGVVIEIHSETDGTNLASLAMVHLGRWAVLPLKNGIDGNTHSVELYIFSRAFNGGMDSGMSEVKMRGKGEREPKGGMRRLPKTSKVDVCCKKKTMV